MICWRLALLFGLKSSFTVAEEESVKAGRRSHFQVTVFVPVIMVATLSAILWLSVRFYIVFWSTSRQSVLAGVAFLLAAITLLPRAFSLEKREAVFYLLTAITLSASVTTMWCIHSYSPTGYVVPLMTSGTTLVLSAITLGYQFRSRRVVPAPSEVSTGRPGEARVIGWLTILLMVVVASWAFGYFVFMGV
jgi:hypothetical protein